MATLPLREQRRDDSLAFLTATLPPQTQPVSVAYRTRTGAVLRVDGFTAGAFDREHHEVVLPPSDRARELVLEVELSALPTNGLPSGPGLIWKYLNARSHERPRDDVAVQHARLDGLGVVRYLTMTTAAPAATTTRRMHGGMGGGVSRFGRV